MNKDEKRAPDPESILARLAGGKPELRYQREQIIYSQGDPADFVFYVRTGGIKVTVVSEVGKEAVVAILQPGDFFGEDCLTEHTLRTATLTALTECVLMRVPKADIIRTLREDADFSALFTTYLVERAIRMQEGLVDQLLNSTEKRLARLLLILANSSNDPVVPKISQETLAEMIGTSRTHVNFFMNKFRQLGFIEYDARGEIKVNRSLLMMLLRKKTQVAPED